ncbi:MAG: hypothetical protein ACOY93_13890 [Bacillota bacterium]
MFRRHPLWIGLLCAALLAGCSLPFWKAKEPEPPAPSPPPLELPAPDPFLVLLPQQDLHLLMEVQDHGAQPVQIAEEWLREEAEQALIATYAGVPYVRWEWNAEGLWRLDPRGGGVMLRYLPPTLTDGAVWKQQSGAETVWFHLARRAEPCPLPGGESADCWNLTVLNRRELLTFTFARGIGPVAAVAENFANRSDSFTKKLIQKGPSQLSPEQRAGLLAQLKSPGRPAAPVQTATLEEFQAARAAVQGGAAPAP